MDWQIDACMCMHFFFPKTWLPDKLLFETCIAAQSDVVLKAESMAEKVEWLKKLRNVIGAKGGIVKGEFSVPMRQSHSDGSLVSKDRLQVFAIMIISAFILFY